MAKLAFPMACFSQLGVTSSKVNTPFLLATKGELAFEISEVVLTEIPDSADVTSSAVFFADARLISGLQEITGRP